MSEDNGPVETEIKTLDKSFSDMLGELTDDEEIHQNMAKLDKKIHVALVKIYQDFHQLEKEFKNYDFHLNKTCALEKVNKDKCLHKISGLIRERNRLHSHLEKIFSDLNSHELSTYDALYHDLKLDDSHKVAIDCACTLIHNTFSSLALALNTQFTQRTLESLRSKLEDS